MLVCCAALNHARKKSKTHGNVKRKNKKNEYINRIYNSATCPSALDRCWVMPDFLASRGSGPVQWALRNMPAVQHIHPCPERGSRRLLRWVARMDMLKNNIYIYIHIVYENYAPTIRSGAPHRCWVMPDFSTLRGSGYLQWVLGNMLAAQIKITKNNPVL